MLNYSKGDQFQLHAFKTMIEPPAQYSQYQLKTKHDWQKLSLLMTRSSSECDKSALAFTPNRARLGYHRSKSFFPKTLIRTVGHLCKPPQIVLMWVPDDQILRLQVFSHIELTLAMQTQIDVAEEIIRPRESQFFYVNNCCELQSFGSLESTKVQSIGCF